MGNATKRNQVILVHVALALATIAAYWQVHTLDFNRYDDYDYVVENPMVRNGLTLSSIRWAMTTGHFSYPHPLTWISHILDCELFGLNAGAHHIMNLMIHVANTLLLFAIFQRLSGGLWRSALVAALFALHPLHVESVAWIAERKDVLSTFFWLLTMLAYVYYAERPSRLRYWLTLGCFGLGLAAKPMVVTLPCVLLLMDFWPLRRVSGERHAGAEGRWFHRPLGTSLRGLLLEKVPFMMLAGIAGLITVFVVRNTGRVASEEAFPWSLRLANLPISYVRYLLKMIWPDQLSALYPMPNHWPLGLVVAATAVLMVGSIVALWQVRRRPYLMFGWLWYLGTLLPTIGLIPVGWQSIADRYTYVPLIGIFVAIVWAAADGLPAWARRKWVAGGAAAIILVACAVKTRAQTRSWQNTGTLFAHAVAVTKDNAIAHYNWGCVLLMEGAVPAAEEQFQAAVRINPKSANAQNNLGRALALKGDLAGAVEHYRVAVRLNPALEAAHFNLGIALKALGQDKEAISHFAATARLSPGHAQTYTELGGLLLKHGRVADAIMSCEHAMRYGADSPILLNNLAWILATHPEEKRRNGAEAVRLAVRACEQTSYQQVVFIGTLAAAFAEVGEFDRASATAQKASDLAQAMGQAELQEMNQKLVQRFRQRQPHRETNGVQHLE